MDGEANKTFVSRSVCVVISCSHTLCSLLLLSVIMYRSPRTHIYNHTHTQPELMDHCVFVRLVLKWDTCVLEHTRGNSVQLYNERNHPKHRFSTVQQVSSLQVTKTHWVYHHRGSGDATAVSIQWEFMFNAPTRVEQRLFHPHFFSDTPVVTRSHTCSFINTKMPLLTLKCVWRQEQGMQVEKENTYNHRPLHREACGEQRYCQGCFSLCQLPGWWVMLFWETVGAGSHWTGWSLTQRHVFHK